MLVVRVWCMEFRVRDFLFSNCKEKTREVDRPAVVAMETTVGASWQERHPLGGGRGRLERGGGALA